MDTYSDMKNSFTVILLFTPNHQKVLLLKRNKNPFAGKLNGCGGKIRVGETVESGALRELEEETHIITKVTFIEKIVKQNKTLYFYKGVISENVAVKVQDNIEGSFRLYDIESLLEGKLDLAGNGDLIEIVKKVI